MSRSPERDRGLALARYLPVQQQSSMQSPQQSARCFQSFQQPQMAQIYAPPKVHSGMQSFDPAGLNQSGYLNISQHQQFAEQQSSFYELLMKEKLESAQLTGQLKEAQRQLEKARKDYVKLLS